MKAVLALAFLALAQAAVIEVPKDEAITFFEDAPIHPLWMHAMFNKYGFAKPIYDDEFITFARAMGVVDPPTMTHLRALYDEPAVMFFQDPLGDVISYYADTGIHRSALAPSTKDIFHDLISASDSMAIVYKPERMLGEYKAVLPGHFFHPVKDVALSRLFAVEPEEVPHSHEHSVVFSKSEISNMFPSLRYIPGRFDFDELPYAYKYPVSLKFDYPSSKAYYFTKPSYYKDDYPASSYVAKVDYPTPAYFRKPYYVKPAYHMAEAPAYYARYEAPYTSAYPYFHKYSYPVPEPFYGRSYYKAPYIKPIFSFDAPFYSHPLRSVFPRSYHYAKATSVPVESSPVVVEAAEPVFEKEFDVSGPRFISHSHLAKAFPSIYEKSFSQIGLKPFYTSAPAHVVAEPGLKAFYPPQPVEAHVVTEPALKAFFAPEPVAAHVVDEPALKAYFAPEPLAARFVDEPALKAFYPPEPLTAHVVAEPAVKELYSSHVPFIAAPL